MAKAFSSNLGYRAARVRIVLRCHTSTQLSLTSSVPTRKSDGVRQKGRAAEYLSGRKPEQIYFLAAWCDEEIPGRAFEEKKQMICPFFLIRHHRVTRESAVGGSPQDSIPLLPG